MGKDHRNCCCGGQLRELRREMGGTAGATLRAFLVLETLRWWQHNLSRCEHALPLGPQLSPPTFWTGLHLHWFPENPQFSFPISGLCLSSLPVSHWT